jgi:hypothetical protein
MQRSVATDQPAVSLNLSRKSFQNRVAVDRVGSLRWRLRAFWHAVLALFGVTGRSMAPMVAFRKGSPSVREGLPSRPTWGGPPDDEVGVPVAARMMVASQPRLFIAVTDCVAYSNGFTLGIAVRSKDEIPPQMMGFGPHREHGDEDPGIQISIRFSDGRDSRGGGLGPNRALMDYYREWSEGKDPPEPVGPIIGQQGGGGGGLRWDFNYFIWPLPPDGPVTITCKWPGRGLQTAGKELNGTAIRAAGLKSRSVWA